MATKYSSNGHYYEEVIFTGGRDWAGAQSAANASSYRGLDGYLATVTSSGENAFIASIKPFPYSFLISASVLVP